MNKEQDTSIILKIIENSDIELNPLAETELYELVKDQMTRTRFYNNLYNLETTGKIKCFKKKDLQSEIFKKPYSNYKICLLVDGSIYKKYVTTKEEADILSYKEEFLNLLMSISDQNRGNLMNIVLGIDSYYNVKFTLKERVQYFLRLKEYDKISKKMRPQKEIIDLLSMKAIERGKIVSVNSIDLESLKKLNNNKIYSDPHKPEKETLVLDDVSVFKWSSYGSLSEYSLLLKLLEQSQEKLDNDLKKELVKHVREKFEETILNLEKRQADLGREKNFDINNPSKIDNIQSLDIPGLLMNELLVFLKILIVEEEAIVDDIIKILNTLSKIKAYFAYDYFKIIILREEHESLIKYLRNNIRDISNKSITLTRDNVLLLYIINDFERSISNNQIQK